MSNAGQEDNREDAVESELDKTRLLYGLWVVLGGLLVVAGVTVAAVLRWSSAADVASVVGTVTGVVGTIVGAYFGIHVGSIGTEKAEAQRDQAQEKVAQLAALAYQRDPDIAATILGMSLPHDRPGE